MESKNSNEQNPVNTTTEPTVHPAPEIDVSQLFQKDPEPVLPVKKPSRFAALQKRKLVFLSVILLVLLVASGVIFAKFSAPNKQSTEPQVAGVSTPETNKDSSDETVQSSSTSADTQATTNTTTPTNATSTTGGTSSGGTGGGSSNTTGGTSATAPAKIYTINYTNSCFSPADIAIKKGDTVKFVNNSSRDMWPASDNHPKHTIYPEFDANKDIAPGGNYSFTFTKIGAWGYHDHNKSNCGGTITVQ